MASNPHNPAMSPHTQGHPGTWKESQKKKKRKKKQRGEWKGGRKLGKHYRWRKDNRLEKTKAALRSSQIAATLSRVTYVNLSTYACDRWLLSNRSILDPNAHESQHLFVVN